jgi:hypothetical protein
MGHFMTKKGHVVLNDWNLLNVEGLGERSPPLLKNRPIRIGRERYLPSHSLLPGEPAWLLRRALKSHPGQSGRYNGSDAEQPSECLPTA